MPLHNHPDSNPNPSDKKASTASKTKSSLSEIAKAKAKGSVVMDTGGGDPMDKGEKWENHPEVERVEQPHNASNGRFAFNSTVGLGKVDPRDRAKGTDPGVSENVANMAKGEVSVGKDAAGKDISGLKAGTRIYANGSYYILSSDVTHDDMVHNYGIWSKYKDGHGENAFLDNGLFVRAQGTVHQEKLPQGAATEDFTVIDQKDVSEFGPQTQRRLEKASQQWDEWKKNPNVGTQTFAKPSPKNWSIAHPGQPLPAPKPKPAPATPAPGVAPSPTQNQSSGMSSSDQNMQRMASSGKMNFKNTYANELQSLADSSGMTVDGIVSDIADGTLAWSDLMK